MVPDLQDILERHMAFWRCGASERPLLATTGWPTEPMQGFDLALPGTAGVLSPDMLCIERLLPQFEAAYTRQGLLEGDLFWVSHPLRGMPWLEAIAGARIRYANESGGSLFTEPVIADWTRVPEPLSLQENPWFLKLAELLDGLARLSAGRFPVGLPHTRGPWDMVGALRGMGQVYTDIHDHPQELGRLADQCADLWITVTRRLAETIPAWHGGFVGIFGLWCPTFPVTPQNDLSVSVSARSYRQLMSRADRLTALAWSSPIFHLHSGGRQIIEPVLDFLDGRALNIVTDPAGPAIHSLLPIFQRIQAQRVPLHVITSSQQSVEIMATHLSPCGLAITYVPPS